MSLTAPAVALAFVLALSACAPYGVTPTARPGATAGSSPTPAATAAAPRSDPPPRFEHLVPVTRPGSMREDLRLSELTEVLAPVDWAETVRGLLPGAKVMVLEESALLGRARAGSDEVALLQPQLVGPSVKTLSIDGQYFWDRALDLTTYPFRRVAAGAAAAEPERTSLWELAAAGEIVFGRGVQERIERYRDAKRPFAKLRELTRAADLAVATLESPLSGNANRYCDSCMRFVGNEGYVAAISDAGFDVVSLANNHIGDAGSQGVLDTMRVLAAAGVAHVGAGVDERAARRRAVLSVAGRRVAILAYTDVPPGDYAAGPDRPGSAYFTNDPASYERIAAEIAGARQGADLVIVIAHWGVEYEDRPRPWVVDAARAMVEAGADVVLGGHPHWVQPVELYRGAYIAYGLGNFVFDQMWSLETRRGSVHRLAFSGATLRAVRIVPTLLEDWHQPRPLLPSEPGYRQTIERIWGGQSSVGPVASVAKIGPLRPSRPLLT